MRRMSLCLITALWLAIPQAFANTDIVLHDTHGNTTSFAALKGHWVLINYWAGWCQTCVDEIPELNRFYAEHQNDPIDLYAVQFDELPLDAQNALIQKHHIKYPSLIKNPAQDLSLGDITGVPVTFIFNPKGQLVQTLFGGQTAASLNKALSAG